MNRAVSMSVAAGALALALAAGSAQAAPAGSGVLGKLTSAAPAATQVETVGHRRRGWRKRCFRRCMWRSDGAYRHCKRKCRRHRGW
jgi:hypothetical protein